MCCSYAETRPGQQEAYEHLKKHLDKVTYLQRRILNQKRRRSRERGVRIMPAILSSGHGQGTMESEVDEFDQHWQATSSIVSVDPEVNKEVSDAENEAKAIRPLTHVLHSVEPQHEVEDIPDMPVLHDAEASLRDEESHVLSQSLSLSPESIGSFDGIAPADLDHLPGIAPAEEVLHPKPPDEVMLRSMVEEQPQKSTSAAPEPRRSTSAAPEVNRVFQEDSPQPESTEKKPKKKKAGTLGGLFNTLSSFSWRSSPKTQDGPALAPRAATDHALPTAKVVPG